MTTQYPNHKKNCKTWGSVTKRQQEN